MLSTGLPVSRYVAVQVSLTTPGTTVQAINTALLIGGSDVIDAGERMRVFASISEVARMFGSDAEEYRAAEIWFSQNPRPHNVCIGRWIKEPTPASLVGGFLTASQQRIANWQAISDGSFQVSLNGTVTTASNLNFTTQSNLNGVASVIQNALFGPGPDPDMRRNVRWTGDRFIIRTTQTGVGVTIGFLTPTGTGTDISDMLRGSVSTATRVVSGQAAETALSALVAIDALYSSNFYGIVVPGASDEDQLRLAAYVEASDPVHYLGITVSEPNTLDMTYEDDLASTLAAYGYNKTCTHYSTTSPYAVVSYLSRMLITQWTGVNTVPTMMFKRLPGIPIEQLSSYQVDALEAKHCNMYVGVANGANVVQNGVSASGAWTDLIVGADALALDVQNALFNALYLTGTKIPQTDFGMQILANRASSTCQRYVTNGFLSPGTWNAPGFGSIAEGDPLALGYYVYAPTIADQPEEERVTRRAPLMQIAAKTAGAIHHADLIIFVNE